MVTGHLAAAAAAAIAGCRKASERGGGEVEEDGLVICIEKRVFLGKEDEQ